jgi:hypothetical protein
MVRRVIYDPAEQEHLARRAIQLWVAAIKDDDSVFPNPALLVLEDMLIEHSVCFKNPGFREECEWRLINIVDVRADIRRQEEEKQRAWTAETRERLRGEGLDVDMPGILPSDHHEERGRIKFRRSSFGFIPYIEIPLRARAGIYHGRLPLPEVIHGPTAHPEVALPTLRMYLHAHAYGFHTNAQPSEIPLRGI